MKLIGYLIIAVGLTLGAVGASTAYLASLSLPDEVLLPQDAPQPQAAGEEPQAEEEEVDWLELATAVWPEGDPDDVAEPLAEPGEPLTPDLLAQLRGAGIEYVRVKSFAFARWEGKWLTLAGIVGLIAGAALIRRGGRASAAAADARAGSAATPEALMDEARLGLLALHEQAQRMPAGAERAHLIMERVGEIQRGQINPVVEGRGRLRARLGLAGYARVMDRFAAAERQVNRAWSAAADGDDDEAMSCLVRGAESLAAARERMG